MSIEDFPMDTPLDAEVVVRFRVPSVCNRNDLASAGMTFEEMVRDTIKEETLFGIVDDYYAVLEVKVWQS